MVAEMTSYPTLWPFLIYGIAVVAMAGIMLTLSHFLGERHKERETDETFESGVKTTGDARMRFPIHFYIVAMFFVIFVLEAVFMFAWAISIRETGWAGFIGILTFVVDLVVVLVYVWRIGALDFGPSGKKILKAYHKRIKNK